LYEELVTESECQRTVCQGSVYTIVPDTLDMMPAEIVKKYEKFYGDIPKLAEPLRSDKNMLTTSEVSFMLQDNDLL